VSNIFPGELSSKIAYNFFKLEATLVVNLLLSTQ